MSLRSELIESIHFSYLDERYPEFTRQEMEKYVRSVRFLEDALLLSNTGILIIEYKTWTYQHCSPNAWDILGYPPEEVLEKGPALLLSAINLEDLKLQRTIHPMMNEYFQSIPEAEKLRYKFCFTSRFKRGTDGREIMLLQNNIFIKWDDQGKPVAKLILFTDITDYKKDDHVVFYSSRLSEEGENRIEMQRCFTPGHSVRMTRRELQVINLIQKGLSTKEIANTFALSGQTIKNIRKSVMKKFGCSNQAQMVRLASLYGLLPA